MRRHVIVGIGCAAIGMAISGCNSGQPGQPGPLASRIAGEWRGRIVTRTTRHAQATHEDFTLSILPNGRFEMIGLVPGDMADQPGRLLRFPPAPVMRVAAADYQPMASHVVLETAQPGEEEVLRVGWSISAAGRSDGLLDFALFSYAASRRAGQSDAVAQFGVLRRTGAATTQGE